MKSRTQAKIDSMPIYMQPHLQKYAVMAERLAKCCIEFRRIEAEKKEK